jgi:hypothetical protein
MDEEKKKAVPQGTAMALDAGEDRDASETDQTLVLALHCLQTFTLAPDSSTS